jgi:hypothetical protein
MKNPFTHQTQRRKKNPAAIKLPPKQSHHESFTLGKGISPWKKAVEKFGKVSWKSYICEFFAPTEKIAERLPKLPRFFQ